MKIQRYSTIASLVVTAVISGLMFAACQSQPSQTKTAVSQSPTSQTNQTSSVKNSIEISQFQYSSSTIRVKAGSTVKVTNRDSVGHSVTSDDGKSFDTDVLSQGQSNEFAAPTTPGSYPFHCIVHPSMKGTLIVE